MKYNELDSLAYKLFPASENALASVAPWKCLLKTYLGLRSLTCV